MSDGPRTTRKPKSEKQLKLPQPPPAQGSFEALPAAVKIQSLIVEIECTREPNPEGISCIVCGAVDPEYLYYTPGKKGPLCGQCIESLCDPDQALLLDERLGRTEAKIGYLETQLQGEKEKEERL
jgi:hypothetical protein